MKEQLVLWILIFIFSVSCTEKKARDSEEVVSNQDSKRAYAELSVAEGGKWADRKYEGGNSFKNVDELWVPSSHTDHSYYVRYEGPGWESDKVGYRLYLDWRNAIDIFGKTTDQIVLDQVGQDGFDSYHEMSDWGMDILKVGKSLGIGSYGRLADGKVHHFKEVDSTYASVQNGSDVSAVNINYYGWKTDEVYMDLSVDLSIESGKRLTKAELKPSDSVSGLVTGIVKFDDVKPITSKSEEGEWSYLATFGEQTLVPDKLGLAVFYQKSQIAGMENGEFDHLIVFKPTTEQITYYFAGAWEKEKDGLTTEQNFLAYLDDTLDQLNN